MSDLPLLHEIWKPVNPISRKHELLREELHAAVNSLDLFETVAARSMLQLFKRPVPTAGGYSIRDGVRYNHGSSELVRR